MRPPLTSKNPGATTVASQKKTTNQKKHRTKPRRPTFWSKMTGGNERQIRHNLRPNRERDYSNHFGHAMDNPASSKIYDAQFYNRTKNAANTERRDSERQCKRCKGPGRKHLS